MTRWIISAIFRYWLTTHNFHVVIVEKYISAFFPPFLFFLILPHIFLFIFCIDTDIFRPCSRMILKAVIPRLTQWLSLKCLPTRRALYYLGCISHYSTADVVRLSRAYAAIWDAASSLAANWNGRRWVPFKLTGYANALLRGENRRKLILN